jgi:hypothetical protein
MVLSIVAHATIYDRADRERSRSNLQRRECPKEVLGLAGTSARLNSGRSLRNVEQDHLGSMRPFLVNANSDDMTGLTPSKKIRKQKRSQEVLTRSVRL